MAGNEPMQSQARVTGYRFRMSPTMLRGRSQAAKLKEKKRFNPGSDWGSFACEANRFTDFPMESVDDM